MKAQSLQHRGIPGRAFSQLPSASPRPPAWRHSWMGVHVSPEPKAKISSVEAQQEGSQCTAEVPHVEAQHEGFQLPARMRDVELVVDRTFLNFAIPKIFEASTIVHSAPTEGGVASCNMNPHQWRLPGSNNETQPRGSTVLRIVPRCCLRARS